jgi:hypothetical protein
MKSKSMAHIKSGGENSGFNSVTASGRANHIPLRAEKCKITRPPQMVNSLKSNTHDSQEYGNDDFR